MARGVAFLVLVPRSRPRPRSEAISGSLVCSDLDFEDRDGRQDAGPGASGERSELAFPFHHKHPAVAGLGGRQGSRPHLTFFESLFRVGAFRMFERGAIHREPVLVGEGGALAERPGDQGGDLRPDGAVLSIDRMDGNAEKRIRGEPAK